MKIARNNSKIHPFKYYKIIIYKFKLILNQIKTNNNSVRVAFILLILNSVLNNNLIKMIKSDR